jgi:hypothetical protein
VRQGIKELGYAHIKSSAVDHMVKDVAFGGRVSLWCDWDAEGIVFTVEPRVRGRVCVDCTSNKKAAIYKATQDALNSRPAAKTPDGRDL